MSAIAISFVVFACLFLGSLAGMALRRVLPEQHLVADSKEVIKVGTGLIGTMAALLLGLLVASAKSSFDTEKGELTQMAAKIVFIDRLLSRYGPETHDVRERLRSTVAAAIDQMWPPSGSQPVQLDPSAASGEHLFETLHQLSPKNGEQAGIKAQALTAASEISQVRWLLFSQKDSSISTPMLVVVVFWLSMIFVSFGLFAYPNATVIVTMGLCALAVAGAIFLVLELDQPFGGMIQISSAPLRTTLEHLGK